MSCVIGVLCFMMMTTSLIHNGTAWRLTEYSSNKLSDVLLKVWESGESQGASVWDSPYTSSRAATRSVQSTENSGNRPPNNSTTNHIRQQRVNSENRPRENSTTSHTLQQRVSSPRRERRRHHKGKRVSNASVLLFKPELSILKGDDPALIRPDGSQYLAARATTDIPIRVSSDQEDTGLQTSQTAGPHGIYSFPASSLSASLNIVSNNTARAKISKPTWHANISDHYRSKQRESLIAASTEKYSGLEKSSDTQQSSTSGNSDKTNVLELRDYFRQLASLISQPIMVRSRHQLASSTRQKLLKKLRPSSNMRSSSSTDREDKASVVLRTGHLRRENRHSRFPKSRCVSRPCPVLMELTRIVHQTHTNIPRHVTRLIHQLQANIPRHMPTNVYQEQANITRHVTKYERKISRLLRINSLRKTIQTDKSVHGRFTKYISCLIGKSSCDQAGEDQGQIGSGNFGKIDLKRITSDGIRTTVSPESKEAGYKIDTTPRALNGERELRIDGSEWHVNKLDARGKNTLKSPTFIQKNDRHVRPMNRPRIKSKNIEGKFPHIASTQPLKFKPLEKFSKPGLEPNRLHKHTADLVLRRLRRHLRTSQSREAEIRKKSHNLKKSEARAMTDRLRDLMTKVRDYDSLSLEVGNKSTKHDVGAISRANMGLFSDVDIDSLTNEKPTEADRELLKNIEQLTFFVLGHHPDTDNAQATTGTKPDFEKESLSNMNNVNDRGYEGSRSGTKKSGRMPLEAYSRGFHDRTRGIDFKKHIDSTDTEEEHDRRFIKQPISDRRKLRRKNKLRMRNGRDVSMRPLRESYVTSSLRKRHPRHQREIQALVPAVKHRKKRSLNTIELMDDFRLNWPALRTQAEASLDTISRLKTAYDVAADDLSRLVKTGNEYNQDARSMGARDKKINLQLKKETAKLKTAQAEFEKFQKQIAREETTAMSLERKANKPVKKLGNSPSSRLAAARTIPDLKVKEMLPEMTLDMAGPIVRVPLNDEELLTIPREDNQIARLKSTLLALHPITRARHDENLHKVRGDMAEISWRAKMMAKAPTRIRRSSPKTEQGSISNNRVVKKTRQGSVSSYGVVRKRGQGRVSTNRVVKTTGQGRVSNNRVVKTTGQGRVSNNRVVKTTGQGRVSNNRVVKKIGQGSVSQNIVFKRMGVENSIAKEDKSTPKRTPKTSQERSGRKQSHKRATDRHRREAKGKGRDSNSPVTSRCRSGEQGRSSKPNMRIIPEQGSQAQKLDYDHGKVVPSGYNPRDGGQQEKTYFNNQQRRPATEDNGARQRANAPGAYNRQETKQKASGETKPGAQEYDTKGRAGTKMEQEKRKDDNVFYWPKFSANNQQERRKEEDRFLPKTDVNNQQERRKEEDFFFGDRANVKSQEKTGDRVNEIRGRPQPNYQQDRANPAPNYQQDRANPAPNYQQDRAKPEEFIQKSRPGVDRKKEKTAEEKYTEYLKNKPNIYVNIQRDKGGEEELNIRTKPRSNKQEKTEAEEPYPNRPNAQREKTGTEKPYRNRPDVQREKTGAEEEPYQNRPNAQREKTGTEKPYRNRPDVQREKTGAEEEPYQNRPNAQREKTGTEERYRNRPDVQREKTGNEEPYRNRPNAQREKTGNEEPYRNRPNAQREITVKEEPYRNRPNVQGEKTSAEEPYRNRPNARREKTVAEESYQNRPNVQEEKTSAEEPYRNKPNVQREKAGAEEPYRKRPINVQEEKKGAEEPYRNRPNVQREKASAEEPYRNRPNVQNEQEKMGAEERNQNRPNVYNQQQIQGAEEPYGNRPNADNPQEKPGADDFNLKGRQNIKKLEQEAAEEFKDYIQNRPNVNTPLEKQSLEDINPNRPNPNKKLEKLVAEEFNLRDKPNMNLPVSKIGTEAGFLNRPSYDLQKDKTGSEPFNLKIEQSPNIPLDNLKVEDFNLKSPPSIKNEPIKTGTQEFNAKNILNVMSQQEGIGAPGLELNIPQSQAKMIEDSSSPETSIRKKREAKMSSITMPLNRTRRRVVDVTDVSYAQEPDVGNVVVGFHGMNYHGDLDDVLDNDEDALDEEDSIVSDSDEGDENLLNLDISGDDYDDCFDEDYEVFDDAEQDGNSGAQRLEDMSLVDTDDLDRVHALKLWDNVGADVEMYAAPDRDTVQEILTYKDPVVHAQRAQMDLIGGGKDLINDLEAELYTPKKDPVIEGLVAPGVRQEEKDTIKEARLLDAIPSLDTIEDVSGVLKAAGRDVQQELKARNMGIDADRLLNEGDLDPFNELIDDRSSDAVNDKYISFFKRPSMSSSVRRELHDIVDTRQKAARAFKTLRRSESLVDESILPAGQKTALDEQIEDSIDNIRRQQKKHDFQGQIFAKEDQQLEADAIKELEQNNEALIDQRFRQSNQLEEDLKAAASDQVDMAARRSKMLHDLAIQAGRG